MKIALVLGLLGLTLVLFPLEILSVDVLALGGLVILLAFGCLTPDQAFASFGSEMMVLLGSIFVIAGALMRTGVLDSLGLFLFRHSGGRYRPLVTSIVLVVAAVSAFMNNTVVTAVFVPVVLAVARRAGIAASKLLMPVAFAAMLGGTCTLVGTSTNMAAANFLLRRGLEPFHLFEFVPLGVPLILVGVLFFSLWGERLLPARGGAELTHDYQVKSYLSEVVIRAHCPLVGGSVETIGLADVADITILGILRDGEAVLAPAGHEVLRAEDILIVKGQVDALQKLRQQPGIETKADVVLGDRSLQSGSVKLVEVMIGPASRFRGRTLKEIGFRSRFGLTVLALHRLKDDVIERVGRIPLELGDILLVQGPDAKLNELRQTGNVLVLSDLSQLLSSSRKGVYVLLFFGLSLLAGAFGLLGLAPAVLAAALFAVLVKAVPYEEVYRLVDWRLMMLIGGMTGFGQAMIHTGADRFLAELVIRALGGFGPMALLAGFYVLTVALTQPLSNAAAALAVLPIAIASAEQVGANPRTFAMVVTIAASFSFITPLEPSCVLVYPAGRYRFGDFVRVGGLLTLVAMVVVLLIVPFLWPLKP